MTPELPMFGDPSPSIYVIWVRRPWANGWVRWGSTVSEARALEIVARLEGQFPFVRTVRYDRCSL